MNPPLSPVSIRTATAADIDPITAIYAHHVLYGTATFETEPPAVGEMQRRLDEVNARGLPWIVAEAGGVWVGYGYAGAYRLRPAYRYTVEDSIYLHPAWTGRGIGGALLRELIRVCEAAGCRQMVAVIGDSANAASIAVHRQAGFADAGCLRDVGYKFGRWLDTVIMQRPLGPGAATAPDPAARVGGGCAPVHNYPSTVSSALPIPTSAAPAMRPAQIGVP